MAAWTAGVRFGEKDKGYRAHLDYRLYPRYSAVCPRKKFLGRRTHALVMTMQTTYSLDRKPSDLCINSHGGPGSR